MGFAMMRVTMLIATLMVATAVLTSTRITALIAYVITKKTVLLGFLPLVLAMASVMTRLTILPAIMMEETVVDIMSTLIFVLTVDAISMRLVLLVLIP
jgi:hypothetical protein